MCDQRDITNFYNFFEAEDMILQPHSDASTNIP